MNNKNFIRVFRLIAILEGISLLVLFFLAMPLKYWFNTPQLISPVGMSHGLLFVGYVILASLAYAVLRWSIKDFVIVILASFIPFGTFYVEKKYLKDY